MQASDIVRPVGISLFRLLREEFGDVLSVVRCTKATLVHLSHTLEDIVLSQHLPSLLFTGFQESSHWREETERYLALANVAQQVCIFAGGKLPPESSARELHITLRGDDPLRQEWFLLILSQQFSVLLCGQDRAVATQDEATRQFDTIWSFEPDSINRVLDLLERVVRDYRPERLEALQRGRQQFQPGPPDPAIMTLLTAQLIQFEEHLNANLRGAKEAAEQAERAKDDFLASMSHELRTPLNAVLGLSEALLEEVYGPITPDQQRSLVSIEESGRHLLSIINDILDLSKIGAGKALLQLETVAVEPVCEASLRLIREIARKRHLTITFTLDSTAVAVYADAFRLKQMLVNLLSNAVKFTPQGGTIGLEITADQGADVVRFTVWDTGIGIAAEDLPRLFRPFVQVDSSLARRYAGTGLGLALVSRLADVQHGSVTVESGLQTGSRFTITLPSPPLAAPLARATGSTEPANVASAPRGIAGRVPVVVLAEDNVDNARMFVDYLEVNGYRVITARDGREAVARTRETRPDVVVMDIQMPEMNGLEAIRRIRTFPELTATPIIAVTALAMPGDRERCIAAGASDYLTKPVSLKALMSTIEALIHTTTAGS